MYRLKKIKQKIMVKNQKLKEERMGPSSKEPKESVPEIFDREEFLMPVVMPAPTIAMPTPVSPMAIPVPVVVILEKKSEKSFADKHVQVNLLKREKPATLIEEGTLVVCDILDKQHRCKCGKIHSLIDSVCSCEIKSKLIHEGQLIVSKCCSDLVEAACNKDGKGKCSNVPRKVDPVPVENLLKPEIEPTMMIEEGTLVVCDLLDKKHRCKCGKINSLIDSVCSCEIKSSRVHEGHLVVSKCFSDLAGAACNRNDASKCSNVQREAVNPTDASQKEFGSDKTHNLNHASDNKNEKEATKIKEKCATCQKTKKSEDEREIP